MPIRPNALERLAFNRSDAAPAPLLDVFGALSFRVMIASLRLGIFDALSRPTALASLSGETGIAEEALEPLLTALEGIGYVERTPQGWIDTPAAGKWLADGGSHGVRNGVEYWTRLLDGPLADLERTLTSEERPPPLYGWLEDEPETGDLFQEWMVEIAALTGSAALRRIAVGDARTLLDVGGGHGWYAIELCRRNPGLSAVILDHPGATRRTGDRIAQAGLTHRIEIINDDYTTFQSGSTFDLVLMFNILHGHKPAALTPILAHSRTWVAPGGRLVILDQFARDRGSAKPASPFSA